MRTSPLFVLQDDLFFSARDEAVARWLGLSVRPIALQAVEATQFEPGSVVVLQVTLNPARQLQLVERLRGKDPPPTVVAVAANLETDLRRRARAIGAIVGSHSAMQRTIARACSLRG